MAVEAQLEIAGSAGIPAGILDNVNTDAAAGTSPQGTPPAAASASPKRRGRPPKETAAPQELAAEQRADKAIDRATQKGRSAHHEAVRAAALSTVGGILGAVEQQIVGFTLPTLTAEDLAKLQAQAAAGKADHVHPIVASKTQLIGALDTVAEVKGWYDSDVPPVAALVISVIGYALALGMAAQAMKAQAQAAKAQAEKAEPVAPPAVPAHAETVSTV